MEKKIEYRAIRPEELTLELFDQFIRHQIVRDCVRRAEGAWVIREDPFIDDWTEEEYAFLVNCFKNTIAGDGMVCGAKPWRPRHFTKPWAVWRPEYIRRNMWRRSPMTVSWNVP